MNIEKPRLHLICNAHIDPVWLWDWEEGVAETLSTFEVAVELCEKYETFIFNHNEAILYQWVEEHAPSLFKRIQKQVRAGRWHVMGGWYLQPDCNMPSGESLVRQVLTGRCYFSGKFGVQPTTAMNVDAFGHSRGLVQILKKSGFNHYLFGRPLQNDIDLPSEDFTWEGLDGSQVRATRFKDWYNTLPGKAAKKLVDRLAKKESPPVDILLWGVGNHGGGPSRKDLQEIQKLIAKTKDREIIHSTPEAYLEDPSSNGAEWPIERRSLRPWGIGTYTSMHSVKLRVRQLESQFFMIEKMVAEAYFQKLMKDYPAAALQQVTEDLLKAQFHDVITGTCIPAAEESSLRIMDHGLEILAQLRQKVFFLHAALEKRAPEGDYVILVHNPHPYKTQQRIEVEFILPEVRLNGGFTEVEVFKGRKALATQVEKESSNKAGEWHKKISFLAELEPGRMNRFVARTNVVSYPPKTEQPDGQSPLVFENGAMELRINRRTGLLDSYCVEGREYLRGRGGELLVMKDGQNSWGMFDSRYDQILDRFRLARQDEAARIVGLPGRLPAVRVIEDGPVRQIVEAVFVCGDSSAILRYILPMEGSAFELEMEVVWNEKGQMLKLGFPLKTSPKPELLGQTVFGYEPLATDGSEQVAQQWAMVRNGAHAFSCINDSTYGLDYSPHGGLRLSLLRSVAYGSCQKLPADRYTPRLDIGSNRFSFRVDAGDAKSRVSKIDREAQLFHQIPFALCLTPVGEKGRPPVPSFIRLSGEGILLSALKRSEDGTALIVRLAETTGKSRKTMLRITERGIAERLVFSPFEVKTLRVVGSKVKACSMVEEEEK